MRSLTVVRKMREPTPLGSELTYLISEGIPWATAEAWCLALKFPSIGHLNAQLFVAVNHLRGLGCDAEAKLDDGTVVYRWNAVAQSMRTTEVAYRKHEFRKPWHGVGPTDWHEWMDRYDALFLWGSNLQERALAAEAHSVRAGSSSTSVHAAVAQALTALQGGFQEHDVRIGEIEKIINRDLDEFITAKQALREKAIDETVMPLVPDRRNWAGLIGAYLKSSNATKGPPSQARLDASSINVAVNTWRRCDAYRAIDVISDKAKSAGKT